MSTNAALGGRAEGSATTGPEPAPIFEGFSLASPEPCLAAVRVVGVACQAMPALIPAVQCN
jgi:hypothetical protein